MLLEEILVEVLCFTYQKAMCYVSLEFPALKPKQDSTMIAHKGAMFFLGLISINTRGQLEYLMPVSS